MYLKVKFLFLNILIERKKKFLKYFEGVKIWRLNILLNKYLFLFLIYILMVI